MKAVNFVTYEADSSYVRSDWLVSSLRFSLFAININSVCDFHNFFNFENSEKGQRTLIKQNCFKSHSDDDISQKGLSVLNLLVFLHPNLFTIYR